MIKNTKFSNLQSNILVILQTTTYDWYAHLAQIEFWAILLIPCTVPRTNDILYGVDQEYINVWCEMVTSASGVLFEGLKNCIKTLPNHGIFDMEIDHQIRLKCKENQDFEPTNEIVESEFCNHIIRVLKVIILKMCEKPW